MTVREFYVQRRKVELPVFLKVLKALPRDQLGYKPNDRSPSAEQLVWTLASELKAGLDAVNEHQAEWTTQPAPPLDHMVEMLERWSTELIDRVSKMDESSWDKPAQFYYKGKMVSEQPLERFLWFILFDAIHHRGQLAAYLRPMGGKVPAIYGPSADDRSM